MYLNTLTENIVEKFTQDIRNWENRVKEMLNLEIVASNDVNSKLNKELDDHLFTVSVNHSKVVKICEEDREKQVSDINYSLADIRETIETEAVEK